jgi:hypothetical protein
MKKLILLAVAVVFVCASLAYAGGNSGPMGPAPNSGDGIPDGSGFDGPNGPSGAGTGSGSGPRGSAPNSGDGIPDGSGFDGSYDTTWEELMM